jgi:RNA polymerase sigma-70 factor (ECF subfamily)
VPNPVSSDDTDARLLRLSEKGNEAAFLTLYRRHQRAVFRFAAHMSGRTEIAEEVVQDVFIRCYRAREHFSPRSAISKRTSSVSLATWSGGI